MSKCKAYKSLNVQELFIDNFKPITSTSLLYIHNLYRREGGKKISLVVFQAWYTQDKTRRNTFRKQKGELNARENHLNFSFINFHFTFFFAHY